MNVTTLYEYILLILSSFVHPNANSHLKLVSSRPSQAKRNHETRILVQLSDMSIFQLATSQNRPNEHQIRMETKKTCFLLRLCEVKKKPFASFSVLCLQTKSTFFVLQLLDIVSVLGVNVWVYALVRFWFGYMRSVVWRHYICRSWEK